MIAGRKGNRAQGRRRIIDAAGSLFGRFALIVRKLDIKRQLSEGRHVMRAGDLDGALAYLQGRLSAERRVQCDIEVFLGNALLEAGRPGDAAKVFAAVIETCPENPHALVGAARATGEDGRHSEAVSLWQRLQERFPKAYSPLCQRSHAHSLLRSYRFDEARTFFAELCQKRPDKSWGPVGLARVAEAQRQWDKAIGLWEQVLRDFAGRIEPKWIESLERCRKAAAGAEPATAPTHRAQAKSAVADTYFRMIEGHDAAEGNAGSDLKFGSVFVVTYGRSGSTLLQGILNSIDGLVLRGENDNFFYRLFEARNVLSIAAEKNRMAKTPNHPWFGIDEIDFQRLVGDFRAVAETVVLADRAGDGTVRGFGFKEVRYDEVGEQLEEYLAFLAKIFPNPAFVFLTRNLDDVAQSGWWRDQPREKVFESLQSVELRFTRFAEGKPNCFHITYEDLVGRTERLEQMFAFLGAPYQPERLDVVMATPHSYRPAQDKVKRVFREF